MAQIHEAIPKIMSELGAIEKGKQNKQQGYSFRGIDDMYNRLHGLLAKHGVFTVPEVVKSSEVWGKTSNGADVVTRTIDVKYDIFAPDGSFVTAVIPGEGKDSSDKASNKAMSAAHKYLFIQLFTIPTDDIEDADYESLNTIADPMLTVNTPRVDRATEPPTNPSIFNEITGLVNSKLSSAHKVQVMTKAREAQDAGNYEALLAVWEEAKKLSENEDFI